MQQQWIYWLGWLLAAGPLAANAQQAPPGLAGGRVIDYPGCQYPSLSLDGEPPAGLADNVPDAFFHRRLPNEAVRKLHGVMLLQVQIDTLGHGCCQRIQNFTHASDKQVRALALDQLVQQGTWQYKRPLGQPRAPVAASITLKLEFDGRFGYTANYFRQPSFRPSSPKN